MLYLWLFHCIIRKFSTELKWVQECFLKFNKFHLRFNGTLGVLKFRSFQNRNPKKSWEPDPIDLIRIRNKKKETSSSSPVKIRGMLYRYLSMSETARKSVSVCSLYSSPTSTSQSTRMDLWQDTPVTQQLQYLA